MKKILPLLLLFALILTGCQKEEPITYEMTMRPASKTLLVGETVKLRPLLEPYVEDAEFTYKSKSSDIASVSKLGVVTANAEGSTKVMAYYTVGEQVYECYCKITVQSDYLAINMTKAERIVGDQLQLSCEMFSDGSKPTCQWTSSDEALATVSEKGEVKCLRVGEVTITAKAKVDTTTYTARCELTIGAEPVITPSTLQLMTGDRYTMTCSYANAQWSSNNSTVASINAQGEVTGNSIGTATISATYLGHTATATVQVSNNLPIHGAEVVMVGDEIQLTTNRDNATWTSSNTAVAEVSSTGMLTAHTAGTTTISVVSGELTGSLEIEVLSALAFVSKTEEMFEGTSCIFTTNHSSLPTTWTSSDESIATVEQGKVSKLSAGSVTITATVGHQSVNQVVSDPTELLIWTRKSLSSHLNEVYIYAEANSTGYEFGSNAPTDNIVWTSSNPSLAWVNNNYLMTGASRSDLISSWPEVTLTARVGSLTATAHVVVCHQLINGYLIANGNLKYNPNLGNWGIEGATEYVGTNNSNVSSSYNGWIDLFTSNESNPTCTSITKSDYPTGNQSWGYSLHGIKTQKGNFWFSLYNAKSIFQQESSDHRYTAALVNGVYGYLVFPSSWTNHTSVSVNWTSSNHSSNTLTTTEWGALNEDGAVFFCAAGTRRGTSYTTYQSGTDAGKIAYLNNTIGYFSFHGTLNSYSDPIIACPVRLGFNFASDIYVSRSSY